MTALFSTFDVSRQVFFTSRLSLGIVNLKPLLPGHVLLLPRRVVSRLSDLDTDEVTDLFLSVQKVGKVMEKAYNAQSLTISLQDGREAGQSVPHVHVHLIPRKATDSDGDNDRIYPAIEEHEKKLEDDFEVKGKQAEWRVPEDEDRKPRSMEDMEKEAEWLKGLFMTDKSDE